MRVAKRNEYRIRLYTVKRKQLQNISRKVKLASPREERDIIERFLQKLWRKM